MSKLQKSTVNMFAGGAGFLVPMLLNLLFTPFIIKNLGNGAYGLQSLVNVIIGYLMVADMGLDIPITKFIAEYKAKAEWKTIHRLVNSSLQIYSLIGLVGFIIIFSSSATMSHRMFNIPSELRGDATKVFMLSGVGFAGGVISMWGKAIFNGLQRYDIANGVGILSNFVSLITSFILVFAGYGIVEYIFIRVLFSLISGLAYFFCCQKLIPGFKLSIRVDFFAWVLLRTQIGYGFVLRLSGMLFAKLDQTLIGSWLGVAAVGIYAVPYLITSSLSALIASICHFSFPMASELYSTNRIAELKLFFLRVSGFVTSLSSLIFVLLIILGDKFLYLWVGPIIAENTKILLVLLSTAAYINALCNIASNAIMIGIGQLKVLRFTRFPEVSSWLLDLSFLSSRSASPVLGWPFLYLLFLIYFFLFLQSEDICLCKYY